MRRWTIGFAALLVLIGVGHVEGAVLVSSPHYLDYGYGDSYWDNFSSALNTATGGSVALTSNFENLAQMLGYDALLLQARQAGGGTGGLLSATEVSNLSAFMATGRRVVMMGENNNWTAWNQQILGIVGGTFVGNVSGIAVAIVANDITASAWTVSITVGGVESGTALGGTGLYSKNFATLWNDNVLTVLDVNVWSDGSWSSYDNGQFGTNVANWLAAPAAVIPEPSTFLIWSLLGGLGIMVGWYRRRKAA